MFNLLKVELYKLKKFKFGHIAVLFMLVMGLLYGGYHIGYQLSYLEENTATIFFDVVSDTSFVFVISLVAALFIGKDFSNHTICNEIKLGYNRFHILLSRMIVACAFAVLLHTIYVISTVLGFSVVRGFDTRVLCVENALWLFTVLIQLVAVISGVVMISFLAKKVSGAISVSVMYAFICCNILRNFISSKIFTMSCFCFVQDNDIENLLFAAISAFVTMIIFSVIATFTFNKADVK
ncbi:MAG: ABC transporter permease [Lachnospiraceae bacterium]|nr:ABC transporter permease [Lachnospiraceae bacterium]